ncbi:quinone oxidoreductase family protein [Ciceribacter ferrooxidans]|uniref:Quinone oxidoreductase n=1 Tax=Ciceribacter ferrooxidans TaxID=2509717 RepID=A0A4Q2T1K1_9HYPH|nr:quinone oxidoreductase [Ciceribacter ferrooxidans]RYC11781.1 quinone oxidoreductase [Ciceribacter ferrooxidans]
MNLVMEFAQPGTADVLRSAEQPVIPPAAGEVRIRQTMAGVNFVDVYHRSGLYPLPLPAVPGVEATGVVEAVGADVTDLMVGDRVAYAGLPAGSYATVRTLPRGRVLRLGDDLPDEKIAGSLLRGLTAHMLLVTVGRVKTGDTVLIHAAAGGLGLILAQWAKRIGARTIGTVGSPEKAELAGRHGLDHAILYRETDFVDETLRLTGGHGVDLAIDGIGADTTARTLKVLRPFGTLANVGQVAGPVPAIEPAALGNRFFIRPSILALAQDGEAYHAAAREWFALLRDGFELPAGQTYALAEAATAHRDMEAGRTTGAARLAIPG